MILPLKSGEESHVVVHFHRVERLHMRKRPFPRACRRTPYIAILPILSQNTGRSFAV